MIAHKTHLPAHTRPAPAVSGAPDPQLEKEIKAIRAETNQSEKRTKLYWLVDKLDKRGRAHSYSVKSIDMRFFTWLIGTLGDQGMLKQALLVLDKIKAAKGACPLLKAIVRLSWPTLT